MPRKLQPSRVPWHPGYPFKPRGGRFRRVVSALTLAVLATGIGGYWYLTDSARVRRIAEEQLTKLLGSRVRIESASVSIFDGIRLDGVKVYVDGSTKAPDALLATAGSIQVTVPIADLVQGEFSRAELLAFEPQVTLVFDRATKRWNFQRLIERLQKRSTSRPSTDEKVSLPKVTLRGGRLSKNELADGKVVANPPIMVEGTLIPDPAHEGAYQFDVSARNLAGQRGSTGTGRLDLARGEYAAQLQNFDLAMIRELFPEEVRRWVDRHGVEGTIQIPEFKVDPQGTKDADRHFRLVAMFEGGSLALGREDLPWKDDLPPSTGPLVKFDDVHGKLIFADTGIELSDMSLLIEGNRLRVAGAIGGYTPQSSMRVTATCDELHVPASPTFLPALPPDAREVWDRFLPRGEGKLVANVGRDGAGHFIYEGRLDIVGGEMTFDHFPFTVHDITGAITLVNEGPGRTRLNVVDVLGHGARGSPNEKADLRVKGTMFPVEHDSGVDFEIHGTNVVGDDALVGAMPDPVQEALAKFAAKPAGSAHADSGRPVEFLVKDGPAEAPAATRPTTGPLLVDDDDEKPHRAKLPLPYPKFGGSFSVLVHRDQGKIGNWRWPIDIDLQNASGAFEEFPYPLDNVTGKMGIRSGYVTLDGITTRRGDASLAVSGQVAWGRKVTGIPEGQPERMKYDLTVSGDKVPIDRTLVESIPAERREWLDNLGLSGTMSIAGKVTGFDAHYDLGLTVQRGGLAPKGSTWTAGDIAGDFRLTPSSFTIEHATGKRGDAPLDVTGLIDWAGGKLKIGMDVSAKGLPLDADLRSALPEDGKQGWDSVRPEGKADVAVKLVPDQPTTITIHPLGLTATPSVMPLRLSDVNGTVVLHGDDITLTHLIARHRDGQISLDGKGSSRPRGTWDVSMVARNATLDDEVRAALPSMLKDTFTALAARGKVDFNLRQLKFTPGSSAPSIPTPAGTPATRSGTGADVDFDLTLLPKDLTISLGVPVHTTAGSVDLKGSVRDDRLTTLAGKFALPAGELSGKPFTNITAKVTKQTTVQGIAFDDIAGTLADGELAGKAAVAFPDNKPVQYMMELVLRNADVQKLVGKMGDQSVSGRMTASLNIGQGNVDDPSTRRGAGDISVTGESLAKVPILLGIAQIANLSLPSLGTSFNDAAIRYNIDGGLVTFESIVLRSPGPTIEGTGKLDLDARVVLLNLWTTKLDILKFPVIGDLFDRAGRELFQFEVRGSIDNPRVGPRSFESFSTTVDKIQKASGGPRGK